MLAYVPLSPERERTASEIAEGVDAPLSSVSRELDRLVRIFGSWAARYAGQPGPPPGDIEVLVVGRPLRSSLYDAAHRAEMAIGKPVNVTIRSRRTWLKEPDRFVQQLRDGPLVRVSAITEVAP